MEKTRKRINRRLRESVSSNPERSKKLIEMLVRDNQRYTIKFLCEKRELKRFEKALIPIIKNMAAKLSGKRLRGLSSRDIENLIGLRLFERKNYKALAKRFGFSEIEINRFFEGKKSKPVFAMGAIDKLRNYLTSEIESDFIDRVDAITNRQGVEASERLFDNFERERKKLEGQYSLKLDDLEKRLSLIRESHLSNPADEEAGGNKELAASPLELIEDTVRWLMRQADFFKGNLFKRILIAEAFNGIKNLNTSKFSPRIVVSSDAFCEVFGGHGGFLKTYVERIYFRVIGYSHFASLLEIVYIDSNYRYLFIFFYKNRFNLPGFVEFIIPSFVIKEVLFALQAPRLCRLPCTGLYSLNNFFFGSSPIEKLLFGMLTQTDGLHSQEYITSSGVSQYKGAASPLENLSLASATLVRKIILTFSFSALLSLPLSWGIRGKRAVLKEISGKLKINGSDGL